jgi:diguanylate cyclase (GGDEF)-like protein
MDRRHGRAALAAALAAVPVVLAAWMAHRWGGQVTPAPGRVLAAGAAATAAALCARAARRGLSRRSRLAWYAHSAACASWAIAPALCWWATALTRTTPAAGAADAGRLAFLGFEVVAVWLTAQVSGGRARVRMLLDGTVVAAALFVVAWGTVLDRVWRAGGHDTADAAVSLVFPLADLVLVTFYGVLVLTEFPRGRRRISGLVALALAALAVADSASAYRAAVDPRAGGQLLHGAWLVAFLLFASAAVGYRGPSPRRHGPAFSRFALYGPYLPLVPALATWGVQMARGVAVPPAETVAGVVIALAILARQMLVLAENRELVASLAAREHDLRHQALHDPLTGLGNRSLLTERLEHALSARRRHARPLALLFLDLDDFKVVNDSLGHPAGDELLRIVAHRVRTALRPQDTVVRLGGDEFAALIEDAPGDGATLARRVLHGFAEPFGVAGRRLSLGASIGLVDVTADIDGRTATDLLRDADVAMYAVKRTGKNGIELFTPQLHHTTSQELELRAALVTALDQGGLDVAYQPLARAGDGRVVAFEALARWTHPVLGSVPPERFVPVAERAHMSPRITAAVLDRACTDLRHWIDLGPPRPLRVSINVPAAELADPELPARLGTALRRHGLTGDRLVVEVTETALMHDVERAVEAVGRIQALGVSLAIDDFGTGYSSLARLGRFAVEALKIDKSFVRDVVEPSGREMVAAIVTLARSRGMRTVAEGVESAEQREVLRDLGCDLLQGYLLGRPVPAAEVPALLRRAVGTGTSTP